VHHVRARTPRFASGGDDYLLILLVESCTVRAFASPAAALAALAAAIAALCTRSRCSTVCCLYTCPSSGPRAMTLTGSGLRLYARYDWQPGGRLESGKFESGLLPQFQQQLRALLFCVWFGVLRIASYLWVSLLGLGVFGAVLAVAYYVFVYCTVSLALSHTSNHSLTCLSIKPPIF
jgi:hypothetical protein